MKHCRTSFVSIAVCIAAILSTPSVRATTKGLNQIVTPDIQPDGELSVSVQQEDPTIGDRYQLQIEYGFTNRFELAAFQGFSPDDEVLNAEYGIIQHKDFLLSAGFANWSTEGIAPQPYLEAGYLKGQSYVMAGVIDVTADDGGGDRHQQQSVLGFAYHLGPSLLGQVDYQAGLGNYSTAGFTYNLTPNLLLNPALYLSNSVPYKGYGYVVLTWNITVHS